MPLIKVILVYLVLTQSFKLILIRRLENDVYVLNTIREELDPEHQYIELSEVKRTKGTFSRHPLDESSHFRYFYAYLHDPEPTPSEENSFYLGFIDLHGRTYIFPKNERLQ